MITIFLLCGWYYLVLARPSLQGTVIVLNGPSGSGKSSIQREFQHLMMPNLWVKVGIDNLFDSVMPDITSDNLSFWQSSNPIRWVENTTDRNKPIITLFTGQEGEKVAYAMNSAIASYAETGCNVIVDYIAYKQSWFADLQYKLRGTPTYYVAVKLPLATLEKREAARATSPQGHGRSHYNTVYGDKEYDLTLDTEKYTAPTLAKQLQHFLKQQKK